MEINLLNLASLAKYQIIINLMTANSFNPAVAALNINEIACMADNVYYESRDENKFGKSAVAHVTLNRVNGPDHPNDICAVVYQYRKSKSSPGGMGILGQFSWTQYRYNYKADDDEFVLTYRDSDSNLKLEMKQYNLRMYEEAVEVSLEAMVGETTDPTCNSKYYYSLRWVKATPYFGKSRRFIPSCIGKDGVYGNHRFMVRDEDAKRHALERSNKTTQ